MVQMKVGTFHNRPCVRAVWPSMYDTRPNWIPVLGPVHSDAEVLNFEPKHLHVDYRFLRKRHRKDSFHNRIDLVFASVITILEPVGADGAQVKIEDLPDDRYPLESYWRTMRRRFQGPYPPYPPGWKIPWSKELHEAYRDETLKDGLICPHRGAPLEGLEPDPDGCVTCPLHGLRWSLESGELRPPPPAGTEN